MGELVDSGSHEEGWRSQLGSGMREMKAGVKSRKV